MQRILIVEDDKSIAELERDYLEINGFTCDIAEDGKTGLEKAVSEDYALVVLDICCLRWMGLRCARASEAAKTFL